MGRWARRQDCRRLASADFSAGVTREPLASADFSAGVTRVHGTSASANLFSSLFFDFDKLVVANHLLHHFVERLVSAFEGRIRNPARIETNGA